jgi:glycosyltransferase involved in cell wall biosynthesis
MRVTGIIPYCDQHREYAPQAAHTMEYYFKEEPGPFTELRVIQYHDKDWKGPGWARNRAMEQDDGWADWFFFMDADDYCEPGAFKAVGRLENGEKAVWGPVCEDEGGEPKVHRGWDPTFNEVCDRGFWLGRGLSMGHFMDAGEAAFIGFDEEVPVYEDMEFFAAFLSRNRWRKFQDEPLVRVRRGLGGTTTLHKGPVRQRGRYYMRAGLMVSYSVRKYWKARGHVPLSDEEVMERKKKGLIDFYDHVVTNAARKASVIRDMISEKQRNTT